MGQTDDLERRVWEHKSNIGSPFTREHNCHNLVWFESHASCESAYAREHQMQSWSRASAIARIEALNPQWRDLSLSLTDHHIYAPERMFEAYGQYAFV